MSWSLETLLRAMDDDIGGRLDAVRAALAHPVVKGDAAEAAWLKLIRTYLPTRYAARRATVVDSRNQFSDQIDIVIHDRHYSPFIFKYDGANIIPAESVYAIFEVKQSLDAPMVRYAGAKAASVRRLHRTSLPIPTAAGTLEAKPLHNIIGGVLSLRTDWVDGLGTHLDKALNDLEDAAKLQLGCCAKVGTFQHHADGKYVIDNGAHAAARFMLTLISQLQSIATVPMIDIGAYAQWLPEN